MKKSTRHFSAHIFSTLIAVACSILLCATPVVDGLPSLNVTTTEAVHISWSPSATFATPYRVVQTTENGDTLLNTQTCSNDILLGVADVPTTVTICSAQGDVYTERIAARRNRWFPIVVVIVLCCIVAVCVWAYLRMQKRKLAERQMEIEKAHVRHTQRYEFATVLFADIQGFTKIAAHMNPEQLVDELDRYFIYFDELVDKYGVEKIKTIGDAYMCAGGVPEQDSANPIEVVLVGLEMIAYVQERRQTEAGFWNIRVGINTGPVISGHLGNIKKVFDIWGDSVNTASRMESSGEPGRVNISETTYVKIQDYFDCEYRGKMPVKYKGEVDMYFVNRLKEEYCQPGSEFAPNALLMRKLQILKISDFEQRVREQVLRGLHTNVQVRMDTFLSRVRMLSTLEGLTDDEDITCGVAAIFCFVLNEMPNNDIVKGKHTMTELMRKMHLSTAQANDINRVVTHITQGRAPESRVEEVLTDAANEVYGRKDMLPLLFEHYDDSQSRGQSQTRNEWLLKHRQHLDQLTFYTDSAKRLSEVPKQKQIELLDSLMTL